MKKIKILLTFDYELPLGYATDYDTGLFAPADALRRIASEAGIPVVLFADVCSAIQFETWDKRGYHDRFVDQLQQFVRGGHDIQLHIHPHWMTSDYSGGTFRPSADFGLSQFAVEKQGHTIDSIVDAAYSKLIEIGKDADAGYQCVAYRAGGYDVEPESGRILQALHRLGVKIDSSVIRGYYLDYTFSHVDYSEVPDLSAWYVSLEGPLVKAAENGILELPITSKPVTLAGILDRRMRKWNNRGQLASRVYRNGGGGFVAANGRQTFRGSIRKIFNPVVMSLDKEYLEVEDLMDIVDFNVAKFQHESRDLVLTAIGHPKSMGAYHLGLMLGFVERVKARYGDQAEFVTYKDVL